MVEQKVDRVWSLEVGEEQRRKAEQVPRAEHTSHWHDCWTFWDTGLDYL